MYVDLKLCGTSETPGVSNGDYARERHGDVDVIKVKVNGICDVATCFVHNEIPGGVATIPGIGVRVANIGVIKLKLRIASWISTLENYDYHSVGHDDLDNCFVMLILNLKLFHRSVELCLRKMQSEQQTLQNLLTAPQLSD